MKGQSFNQEGLRRQMLTSLSELVKITQVLVMLLTLNDSQENDDDEKEKGDVKQDTVDFIDVAIRRLDFITDTTTSSDTLCDGEDVTSFTT